MKSPAGLVRKGIIYAIMALIAFVIILVTIGLFLDLGTTILGGHYSLEKGEILEFFGQLLLVVIGIELLDTIKSLLTESRAKADMVLLVAVTAASREIIIFNYDAADGAIIVGLGVLIASVATGYYLVKRANTLKGERSDNLREDLLSEP